MRILEWFWKRSHRSEPGTSIENCTAVARGQGTPHIRRHRRSAGARRRRGIPDRQREIVEQVTEALVDEFGDDGEDVPAQVLRIAPQAFDARQAVERSWPAPTDCDLLDRAFERLEQVGIVARQDVACCQNCGHQEIGDEIEKARAHRPVRGYTFFHHQDTERAAQGGTLYLAFGAAMPKGTFEGEWLRAEAEIAGEVVAVLQAEGLSALWNRVGTGVAAAPTPKLRRRVTAGGRLPDLGDLKAYRSRARTPSFQAGEEQLARTARPSTRASSAPNGPSTSRFASLPSACAPPALTAGHPIGGRSRWPGTVRPATRAGRSRMETASMIWPRPRRPCPPSWSVSLRAESAGAPAVPHWRPPERAVDGPRRWMSGHRVLTTSSAHSGGSSPRRALLTSMPPMIISTMRS